MTMKPGSGKWTERHVNAMKADVRAHLDRVHDSEGLEGRLAEVTRKIAELESETNPEAQLRRLIYCISGLVHHERFGGLSPTQIQKLTDIAHFILQINRIKPSTSKLSFLYGDLHLILSQIYRKNGDHWRATWEQQMSLHLALRKPSGGKGFQALSLGIRTLRIGFSNLAVEYLASSITADDTTATQRSLARLYQLKALRLSGQLELADNLISASERTAMSEEMRVECEWESICRETMRSGDLTHMLLSTKRGRPHYQESYLCELYLWAHATQSTRWFERLPSLATLVKNKVLKPKRAGLLYHYVKQISECYDTAIPFAIRLRSLGTYLCRTDELIAPDLELLAWLSAARWLYRNNAYDIAHLATKEYQSLSMRLSDGELRDSLLIAADLGDRSWLESAS